MTAPYRILLATPTDAYAPLLDSPAPRWAVEFDDRAGGEPWRYSADTGAMLAPYGCWTFTERPVPADVAARVEAWLA